MPKQAAQNQHYVPKFILRNFLGNAEREQVHVFRKSTAKGFPTSIANIMAERRFYEFRIDENYIASFEDAICEIENTLLPTYRAVLERGRLDGSPEEKAALIAFVAFQFTRTRAQRDMFDTMFAQLGEHLGKMGAKLEDLEGYEAPTEKSRVLQHIQFIKDTTGHLMVALMDKDLLLLKAAPGRSFYLSDNPVCLHNDIRPDNFFSNHGFACEGIQIYLPLSADLMLCAWCPTLMEQLRQKNAADKRKLAAAVLSPAMEFVPPNNEIKAALDKMRPLREIIETRIKHADEGTPMPLTSDNMDFHNSMQVANATQHVVCKQADFALAARFMKENPHHKGLQLTVGPPL